jgi:hypothetical protein
MLLLTYASPVTPYKPTPIAGVSHTSLTERVVISWRSGRKVLYRRTPLATSIVEASSSVHDDLARKRA